MATILIVDNRRANRESLVALLGGDGHRLLQATDGTEGLAVTRAERPDLVIADIPAPTPDGFEFVRRIRTEREVANTRIICCTPHAATETQALAAACGGFAVVRTPCEPERMREAVVASLAGAPPAARAPAGADAARRADERLSVLTEFGRHLGAERDAGRLLRLFCDAARQLVGARHAAVGVPGDETPYRFFFTSGTDEPPAATRERLKPLADVLDGVLAGRSVRRERRDLDTDPAGAALLAVPIASPDRVHGWVCLRGEPGAGAFTDDDEHRIETLAAQVGRVYESASLCGELLSRTSELAKEVADRRRVEADVRASEERFRGAFEHTGVGSALADLESRCVRVNAAYAQAFGYTPDEMVGMAVIDLTHPDDRAECRDRLRRLFAGPEDFFSMEKRFLHRDGHTFWGRTNVALIRDSVGQPLSLIGQMQDMTEQKRAAAEAGRTSDLLRAVADGTTDAVFVKDRDGRYLLFNEAAARFVGKPVAEVIGKDDTALFGPHETAALMAHDRRVMDGGAVVTAEETLTAAGSTRTYLSTKGPYRDAGGRVVGLLGISRDISDRKRTDRRLTTQHAVVSILSQAHDLREAAPRLLQAVGETTEWDVGALWIVDRQKNVLSCVDVWPRGDGDGAEFHALTRRGAFARGEGLPGRVWASEQPAWVVDVATAPDFTRAAAAAKAGLRGGFAFPIRFANELLGVAEFFSRESRRPDGELLLMFDSLGSQIGQFIERKRAEDRLRLFRTQIDRTVDGFEVVDPETGRFLDVNASACAALGYTRDEYLSLSVPDVDPLVAARSWEGMTADGALAGTQTFESVHRRKDGSTFPVEVSFTNVVLDRAYILAVVRDVTARRATEELLRLQDRAIRAVTQGIVITDPTQPDNPIVYAGPGFERTTGYTAAEAVGRNCRFLQGKDAGGDEAARLRAAVRSGQACTVEMRNYRKDGTPFWNEVSVSPITDAEGRLTHFVGVQTDVTARRALEDQYRQAQKMEAVGRLAGGVAHDFNNLLTVINGYSALLLQDVPPDTPFRKMVEEIRAAGERASGLTRQLLAFSRNAIIEPKVLSLATIVQDLERMLRRIVGEDVLLSTTSDANGSAVRADAGQIEQVVLNLVVNARDAMPTGGRLTIEVRDADLDETYTRDHPAVRPGRYVCLAVTDSGCGMDAATAARIFDPFFSTKGDRGTGLGLATVHGIVKQAGGHVAVYSEVGHGTAMKVYLPRVDGTAAAGDSGLVPPVTAKGGEAILLVEDDEAVGKLARRILAGCGYAVLVAREGAEAVRIAAEHAGAIDILVTDVVMPRMGGREVAQRVSQLRPKIKVLFLSGYTDDAVVRHGIVEAEVAFLHKPFTPASLAAKVRDVLAANGK